MENLAPFTRRHQRFRQGSRSVEGTPPPAAAIAVVVAFLATSALATVLTLDLHVIVAVGSFAAGFATGSYYRGLSHRSGGTSE